MKSVTALIVTFNRLTLLKESLKAVMAQERPVDHILVIDNHSSDDTLRYLKGIKDERLIVRELEHNTGGAGGFYEGVRYFQEMMNDDYIWIMDDDTIPAPDCLSKLQHFWKHTAQFGFLASNVRWIDGSPAVMNIPVIESSNWNSSVQKSNEKLYPVLKSASFVSILVPRVVIREVGFPIKEFFIWGDDVEYTERISEKFASYFISQSIVTHKIKTNAGVNIVTENGDRINRYFYDIRNRTFRAKQAKGGASLRLYERILADFLKVLVKRHMAFRGKKIRIIIKGFVYGLFFNPEILFQRGVKDGNN